MSKRLARPAVFLDRDGVIVANRDDYVKCWREVKFLPGALEGLARFGQSDYAVVLVTNQSAVGRGIISMERADEINRRISEEIKARGGRLDACYICPHRPDDGCACRKPAPGLLFRASRELGLDLANSYLVGDTLSDMEAARAAGVRGILVRTGRGAQQARLLARAGSLGCLVVPDLKAALEHVQREEKNRGDVE